MTETELLALIQQKLEEVPRVLSEVEELYNLECAQNFLEILMTDNSLPQKNALDELLFHLTEANAPAEWIEVAESISVCPACEQLNLFANA